MLSRIKELALTKFVQYVMFFYDSVVTKFCGFDVSLCFNAFDSNVGLYYTVKFALNCQNVNRPMGEIFFINLINSFAYLLLILLHI